MWLSRHKECGLVAQDTELFNATIRENIAYGLEKEFEDGTLTFTDIVEAAKAANAHSFISEKFEDGYETKIGERAVRVSGGKWDLCCTGLSVCPCCLCARVPACRLC